MTNIIDDLLLAAQRSAAGVTIQISMDDFRRLISALQFNGNEWVTVTKTWTKSPAPAVENEPKNEPETAENDGENDGENALETIENDGENADSQEPKKRIRRPNQEVNNRIAKRVFELAKRYPNATMDELDDMIGLYIGTIKFNKKTFILDFLNDGKEYTLQTLVHVARQLDRDYPDQFYTAADVAQMGISHRYEGKNAD